MIQYLFRPAYSPAQAFGLCGISGAFDLSEWWIAIPLLAAWIIACLAIADRVGAA